MALRKVIFTSATVAARDLGAAFASAFADGRISGAAVTLSGATLGVAKGFLCAHGRIIENTAALSVALSGSSGVAQLVLVVNVSGEGSVSTALRTAESESALAALTQDDINDGSSTVYEMELALVDLSEGTLLRSAGMAARPLYVVSEAPEDGAADGIYFVVEE